MENKTQKTHRILSVISNSRIKIERYHCPFCKYDYNHKSPSFKTSWSAIWHLSHSHKNEADFEVEIKKLKILAKISYPSQQMEKD